MRSGEKPLPPRSKRSALRHKSKDSAPEAMPTVPAAKGDAISKFLQTMDDPDEWRRIPGDPLEHGAAEDRLLTADELDLIRRVQMHQYGDASYNPYPEHVDFFTNSVLPTPVVELDEPKRRFVPSGWEAAKVAKLVHAIRRGDLVVKADGSVVARRGAEEMVLADAPKPAVYDIWNAQEDTHGALAFHSRHIAAPRMALPGHAESYNPPSEYLLDEGTPEYAAWEQSRHTAIDEGREWQPLPKKYSALRLLPAYARAVHERNARCLDLLFCPRAIMRKITSTADDLLPKLPDARDLRPFPTSRSVEFVGHATAIVSLAVDPTGQWLLTGAKDDTLRLWDVQTGRCVQTFAGSDLSPERGAVGLVAWNPNKALCMFAVAVGSYVVLVVPSATGSAATTLARLASVQAGDSATDSVHVWQSSADAAGSLAGPSEPAAGVVARIGLGQAVRDLHWHRRGDYFCTATEGGASCSVAVHQISRRTSQHPLARLPGPVRSVRFHPTRPQLVLLTDRSVRFYDLVQREQTHKLVLPGAASRSRALAVHPSGDHVLVAAGTDNDAEGRSPLLWFDLDAGAGRPIRTLRPHAGGAGIRALAFHPLGTATGAQTYPLFASAGDDGLVHVVYAQVYADLSADPMIVPVKAIRDFGEAVTHLQWHPTQPWLFCASPSGAVSLYV